MGRFKRWIASFFVCLVDTCSRTVFRSGSSIEAAAGCLISLGCRARGCPGREKNGMSAEKSEVWEPQRERSKAYV